LSLGANAAGILVDHLADRENPWAGLFDAGRIGDAKAVAKLLGDNLKVGKDFIAGHIGKDHTELSAVRPGEGRSVKMNGDVVGAYRTPDGDLHVVGSACTHLGCRLQWNAAETSWDCSCHGSRFDTDGTILTGPATKPLPQM
jgi:Rieske Fe-S protein